MPIRRIAILTLLLVSLPTLAEVVVPGALRLKFNIRDVEVAADGVTVAVSQGDHHGPSPDDVGRLALIDTAVMKVTATRDLNGTIGAVAVDSKYVYVASATSDRVEVLSRQDLSDVTRIFMRGHPKSLYSYTNRLFVVLEGPDATVIYSLPDLKPLDVPPPNAFNWVIPPTHLGKCFYFRGGVFGEEFKTARWLVEVPLLPRLRFPDKSPREMQAPLRYARPPIAQWGVEADHLGMRRIGGGSIVQFKSQFTFTLPLLLDDFPVLTALEYEMMGTKTEPMQFTLRNLITGELIGSGPIPCPRGFEFIDRPMSLRSAAGRVVMSVADTILVLPTAKLAPGVAEPLHFLLDTPNPVLLDSSRTASLRFTARGGKAPISYSLAVNAPALSTDPATGVTTVDCPKLMETAAETAAADAARYGANRTAAPEKILEEMKARLNADFVRLTGRSLTGIPVLVPVPVKATDAQQQNTTLMAQYLMEIPADRVLAAMRARSRPPVEVAAGPTAGVVPGPQVPVLKQKLIELERRNAELEAQVKLLKEVVGGKNGGK